MRPFAADSRRSARSLVQSVSHIPEGLRAVTVPAGTSRDLATRSHIAHLRTDTGRGRTESILINKEISEDEIGWLLSSMLRVNARATRRVLDADPASAADWSAEVDDQEEAVEGRDREVEALLPLMKQHLGSCSDADSDEEDTADDDSEVFLRAGLGLSGGARSCGMNTIEGICARFRVAESASMVRIVNEFLATQHLTLLVYLIANGFARNLARGGDAAEQRAAAERLGLLALTQDVVENVLGLLTQVRPGGGEQPSNSEQLSSYVKLSLATPVEFMHFVRTGAWASRMERMQDVVVMFEEGHGVEHPESVLLGTHALNAKAVGDDFNAENLPTVEDMNAIRRVPQMVVEHKTGCSKRVRMVFRDVMIAGPEDVNDELALDGNAFIEFNGADNTVFCMAPRGRLLFAEGGVLLPSIVHSTMTALRIQHDSQEARLQRIMNSLSGCGTRVDDACGLATALSRFSLSGRACTEGDASFVPNLPSLMRRMIKTQRAHAIPSRLNPGEMRALVRSLGRTAVALDGFLEGDARGDGV